MSKTRNPQRRMFPTSFLAVLLPAYWISAMSNKLLGKAKPRDHLKEGAGILGTLRPKNDPPAPGQHANWMKNLPDKRHLSQLSVPGTHDSAAYNYDKEGKEFWNCQNIPLFSQLDAGIRALDLRYALIDGKLLFVHSVALLDKKAEVVDIIRGLHAWLQQPGHQEETIFVSLKVDNGEPNAADVKAAMDTVLTETANLWVSDHTTETTLDAARGKLVLVRRFPFDRPIGYDVSHHWQVNKWDFSIPLNDTSNARIEDFYLLQGCPGDAQQQIGRKYGYTVDHLRKAQKALGEGHEDLWITFSSAVGDRLSAPEQEDVTPRVMALGRGETPGMNQRLVEWCETGGDGSNKDNRPVGIVFMDFVNIKRQAQGSGEESDFDLIRCFIEKQQVQVKQQVKQQVDD